MKQIRQELTRFLDYTQEKYGIIDSMPIPVCEFGRAHFHKSFRPKAAYGKCVSKKETYYGFKLHTLTTFDGYVTDFVLTPANVDDRAAVWELTYPLSPSTIIGDKGYMGNKFASELKSDRNINLVTIKRKKDTNQFPICVEFFMNSSICFNTGLEKYTKNLSSNKNWIIGDFSAKILL